MKSPNVLPSRSDPGRKQSGSEATPDVGFPEGLNGLESGDTTGVEAAHGGGPLRCFVSPEAAQSKRTISTEQHDSVNLFGAVAVSGRIFGVTPPARRDAQKNFEKRKFLAGNPQNV